MKAYTRTKYGSPDVLKLEELPKPVPNDDEVLVEVRAASINALDWHMLTADVFILRFMGGGLFGPKNPRLGADAAGVVEAVGKDVTQFKPGDAVYGDVQPWGSGGFGEYVCAPERAFTSKPATLSFEQVAAVPVAALTALQGLRDEGKIQAGQKVLIQGASGGVGTFAVQIAKSYETEVTAVCSTRNLEQAVAMGADHVIDYSKEDFTKNGQQYDLILAANGYQPISAYKRALTPTGVYVMAGGKMRQMMEALMVGGMMSKRGGRMFGGVSTHASQEDLIFMNELLESGKVVPAIEKIYPFDEVREALHYFGQGHARGKIVITVK